MHLASSADGLEILSIELTTANVHDCMASTALIENQENIGTIYADGAYTAKRTFDAIASILGPKPRSPFGAVLLLSKNLPPEKKTEIES